LLQHGKVPGLEKAKIVESEVRVERSRFDFLLEDDTGTILLEVKSCTLFSNKVAMFPDAVTARGKKHLEELTRLSAEGTSCAVLFLIHWPRAEVFLMRFRLAIIAESSYCIQSQIRLAAS
jgi:sugar fermentation stimulation protein A